MNRLWWCYALGSQLYKIMWKQHVQIMSKMPTGQCFIERSRSRYWTASNSSRSCRRHVTADTNKPTHTKKRSIFRAKHALSTILTMQLFCYECHPRCFSTLPPWYRYSKQVCGGLFMCGDISKCQGVNLCCLCGAMLLMVPVPETAPQPGLKDKSSMARTSEASLSAESSPRITTW